MVDLVYPIEISKKFISHYKKGKMKLKQIITKNTRPNEINKALDDLRKENFRRAIIRIQ